MEPGPNPAWNPDPILGWISTDVPLGTGPSDALGLPVPDGWSSPVATDRASLDTLEEEFDLRRQTGA